MDKSNHTCQVMGSALSSIVHSFLPLTATQLVIFDVSRLKKYYMLSILKVSKTNGLLIYTSTLEDMSLTFQILSLYVCKHEMFVIGIEQNRLQAAPRVILTHKQQKAKSNKPIPQFHLVSILGNNTK